MWLIIDIVNWGCDKAFFGRGMSDGAAIFHRVVERLKAKFTGLSVPNTNNECSSARRQAR